MTHMLFCIKHDIELKYVQQVCFKFPSIISENWMSNGQSQMTKLYLISVRTW